MSSTVQDIISTQMENALVFNMQNATNGMDLTAEEFIDIFQQQLMFVRDQFNSNVMSEELWVKMIEKELEFPGLFEAWENM